MHIKHGSDELSDFKITFSEHDREFMRAYYRLAEMVADLIGPHSEVVLHSFEDLDTSVVKIVNGHHTGRTMGSPITDMGLKMLHQFLLTGEVNSRSYFTKNKQGQLLKSTTCVIAGENEKAIGLFCVNINLSVPFPDLIRTLLPDNTSRSLVSEHFSTNSSEVIDEATQRVILEVEADTRISPKYQKKAVVFQLFENGIFELKESAGMVAEKLGISRHAIYKYLREFRAALKEEE